MRIFIFLLFGFIILFSLCYVPFTLFCVVFVGSCGKVAEKYILFTGDMDISWMVDMLFNQVMSLPGVYIYIYISGVFPEIYSR